MPSSPRTLADRFRELLGRHGRPSDGPLVPQHAVRTPEAEPPIKLPNPPDGEAGTVLEEETKIASRDAPGG